MGGALVRTDDRKKLRRKGEEGETAPATPENALPEGQLKDALTELLEPQFQWFHPSAPGFRDIVITGFVDGETIGARNLAKPHYSEGAVLSFPLDLVTGRRESGRFHLKFSSISRRTGS